MQSMDVHAHATTIVDHSVSIEAGDNVMIRAPSVAEDLVVALYERCGERGATPMLVSGGSPRTGLARAERAFLRVGDPDEFALAEHQLAAMEATDVVILIFGSRNINETSDVDPAATSAYRAVQKPILDEQLAKRWVITQFPTPADAQKAAMSTAAYEEFVYNAIDKDWAAQREHQEQMVERLDAAAEVRIVSGETTDMTMTVGAMTTGNDYGKQNLPGGEAYTVPVPDSVEGAVLFDKPVVWEGREIEDAFLRFEDGEVVAHSASKNETMLTSILETDPGARRLGELGIGMNRDIDRFTSNILFDEKMGDTIHLAVGQAIEECVPEDMELNESAQHVDMIVDMSEDSIIELDGDVVQRDGTFVFEDGFEPERAASR